MVDRSGWICHELDAVNVQRMMALRREQHVEQVEQIVGTPRD